MKRNNINTLSVFIVFCLLLLSTTITCNAEQGNPDYTKVSTFLFPETNSWTPVRKMKIPDKKYVRSHENQLRNAYRESKFGKEWEDKYCSFIGRVFSEDRSFPNNLYIHDADGDSNLDVIYTGLSQCAEGNSTIIWFGTKHGFVIKQDIFWHTLALRVKEGNPVRLSSVAVGCCGSVIDEYYVGPLFNLRNQGIRNITSTTTLPQKDEKPVPFVATNSELVLRSSPERKDTYDEGLSGWLGVAVFGNILTKFLPGCSGSIIGRHVDRESKLWLFVVVDKKCDALRAHVPYNVSAGWIEAATIKQ
jgi:hypothetical protein